MAKFGMDHKGELRKAFNTLRGILPELAAGAVPLGMGRFGIVIAKNEDIVSKILFRPKEDDEGWKRDAARLMEREISVLRLFREHAPEDIVVPALVGEPQALDIEPYMAVYHMTRITGSSSSLVPEDRESIPAYRSKYERAGALMAKFHRAMEHVEMPDALRPGPNDGQDIVQVPLLSVRTNEALAAANAYMRANMKPGNIHGDFHLGNILDRGDQAMGLLDFSYTGRANNKMTEFWNIPEEYQGEAMTGYERESGEKIGHMVDAAALSLWAHFLNRSSPDQEDWRLKAIVEINTRLNNMIPVTGIKP